MVIKFPTGKIATAFKEVEELMIPPDGVKQKLDEIHSAGTLCMKSLMES